MTFEVTLSLLRKELSSYNLEFLDFITKRQVLVNKIQDTKKSLGKVNIWDPKQEYKVFFKLIELKPEIENNYLYMLSMLIETQASDLFDYPKWSKAEHLNSVSGKITDYVNPILLYILNPDAFNQLDLKNSFKKDIIKFCGE
jgi:chorismate mutase